ADGAYNAARQEERNFALRPQLRERRLSDPCLRVAEFARSAGVHRTRVVRKQPADHAGGQGDSEGGRESGQGPGLLVRGSAVALSDDLENESLGSADVRARRDGAGLRSRRGPRPVPRDGGASGASRVSTA